MACLLPQLPAKEHDLCLPYSSPYQDEFSLQAEAQLELDLAQGTCALQAETVTKLLTLKQVEDNSKAGDNTTILSDTMANLVPGYTGGEWSLFFANCQKPSVVSFNLNVAMYNMHNGQKDYLSVGEDMIPSVYLVSLPEIYLFCKVNLQITVCQNWAVTGQPDPHHFAAAGLLIFCYTVASSCSFFAVRHTLS